MVAQGGGGGKEPHPAPSGPPRLQGSAARSEEPPPVADLVDTSAKAAYSALLANRNYRLYFFASLGSSLGDWAGLVALQTLVITLSQGTRLALFALGAIMMARLVPSIVMGPVAGVLADRYDRKRLMVFCDVVRGLLFIGIAFNSDLLALFALTFIIECLSLLFVSAKDASLPLLVEPRQLGEATSLNLLATYGTLPLGGALAAAMTALVALLGDVGFGADGVRLALLVNAGSFLVAAVLFGRLRLPVHGATAAERDDRPGFGAELRAGLEFIAERPLVRSLILGVTGVFFGAGVVVALGPEFVRTELGRPETDWALMITAVGAGMVLGIALVGTALRNLPRERLFPWCLAATGGIATVIATVPSFAAALVLGFALGASAGGAFVTGYTLLQQTPDEVRSRTFAAFYTATRIALFAALGLAPFLAATIGRGTIIVGTFAQTLSGTRIALLLGGLFALASAVSSGRGMYRALRHEPDRPGRLRLPSRAVSPVARSQGLFIAVEGGEGTGKSTQVATLAEALRAEGHDVLVTREPGGPPVAERIRQVVLDPAMAGMQPRTEALLYAAARAEHVQGVILPALEAGRVVVCDRFLDSSLVYQGFGRGLGEADVFEINRWAIADVLPQVVVLLNLDPEEGLRRVAERARRDRAKAPGVRSLPFGGPDRMEREDLAFHRRVAEGYLKLAARDRTRFVVVDASADAGTVARQVRSGLHAWLPLPSPAAAAAGAGAPAEADGAQGHGRLSG